MSNLVPATSFSSSFPVPTGEADVGSSVSQDWQLRGLAVWLGLYGQRMHLSKIKNAELTTNNTSPPPTSCPSRDGRGTARPPFNRYLSKTSWDRCARYSGTHTLARCAGWSYLVQEDGIPPLCWFVWIAV